MKNNPYSGYTQDDLLREFGDLWQQRDAHIDVLLASSESEPRAFTRPRRHTSLTRRLRQLIPVLAVIASVAAVVAFPDNFRASASVRALGALLLACSAAAVVLAFSKRMQAVPQAVCGSLMLFLMMLFTSCSTLGDGHAVTQNHHGRAEAVASVNHLLGLQP